MNRRLRLIALISTLAATACVADPNDSPPASDLDLTAPSAKVASPSKNPSCLNPVLAPPAGQTVAKIAPKTHVVSVFWGPGVNALFSDATHGIQAFYRDLGQSEYFAWLSEYGVVSLDTNGTNTTITPTTVFNVTSQGTADAQLQTEIRNQIKAGKLPAPNADGGTIYVVTFPKGAALGALVAAGVGAYHQQDSLNHQWEYVVLPDQGDTVNLDGATRAVSHEIIEAVTDPDGRTGLRDVQTPAPGGYCGGEIGDICQAATDNPALPITVGGNRWLVQKMWSNVAKGCVIDPWQFGGKDGGRWLTWYQAGDQWLSADFDGVNGPDVAHVYASGTQYAVEVVTNGGAGTLTHPSGANESNAGVVDASSHWLTGDFDGDGRPDLARVYNASGHPGVDLHINNGRDAYGKVSFTRRALGAQIGGFASDEVFVAGDLNKDGYADIGIVWNDAGYASIGSLLNNRAGGFVGGAGSARVGGFAASERWLLGNFDGDAGGTVDFAAVWNNLGRSAATVFANNGAARFTAAWAATDLGAWSTTAKWVASDFSGDGVADLSVSWNDNSLTSTVVYLNQRTWFSGARWQTRAGGWADDLVFFGGDFDRAGGNDLMILWNDSGTGSFSFRPQQKPTL